MSTRNQLVCLWSGYAFFIVYLLGIVFVAGFIPPPAPGLSGEAVAAFFAQRHGSDLGRHVHLCVCVGAVRLDGRRRGFVLGAPHRCRCCRCGLQSGFFETCRAVPADRYA